MTVQIRPVILSGGTGTRLWPVSREGMAKQLLPLTDELTMLQKTLSRVVGQPGFGAPMVVGSHAVRFTIKEQVEKIAPQAMIVLEPVRRDTMPAVLLAATIAAAEDENAVLAVMPSDHIVTGEDEFRAAVRTAAARVEQAGIAVIGVKPTEPATGYGYIRPGAASGEGVMAVERFVEKPDAATAAKLIAEGCLWNAGLFCFRAGWLIEAMAKLYPEDVSRMAEAVRRMHSDLGMFIPGDAFGDVHAISFDHAFMEKTRDAHVVAAGFTWSDVGDWNALWKVAAKDKDGNAAKGDVVTVDARNNLVRAETRTVCALGVDDLTIVETADAVLVAPREELATKEKLELEAKQQIADIEPLRTEVFQLNYQKAENVGKLLGDSKQGMLSKRGSSVVDVRTNKLFVQDTASRLDDVRRLIGQIDVAVRQVLIEARIVIVNDDFTRELGVRAGVTGTKQNGNDGVYVTSGSLESTDTSLSSALENLRNGNATPYPIDVPTGGAANQRYNINLPVASPAGRLAFMVLGSDYIVDLELSAAQAEGRGEIISSPRVITANQKEASIEQGVEIPYQQSASSGATTIQFKKAVLSLKVKPLITPDNRIILDLAVTKDSVGKVIVTSGGVNVPAIDTRTLTTQVLVGDGETVVLGGILETTRRDTENKVPLIGDIPVLGHLFKNTIKVNNKDELLIFVTPKILREGAKVN